METEPQKLVVMMVVVEAVEPVLLDRNVAKGPVFVNQAAVEDFVVMMVVAEALVVCVLQLNPVRMVFVSELQLLNVETDNVEATEQWEVVALVPVARDAEPESVSATMIVTKEIVVMRSSLPGRTPDYVLKDHVVFAPTVSPAVLMGDAPHSPLALSSSQLLIVQVDLGLPQVVRSSLPLPH